MKVTTTARRERGFSLIEMMITLSILTVVLGVVFMQLGDVQKKYRSEEARTDMSQEARVFLDQITRDLHQAGYPTLTMFDKTGSVKSADDNSVAKGLLSSSTETDLSFEGDVDGDGTVEVVRYRLADDGKGNCPCTLTRSQMAKGSSTEYPSLAVQYVVNSSSSSPRPITGTTPSGNSTGSNDSLYAVYKKPSVFQYFDKLGNPTDPAVARTVRVTLNVLGPSISLDTRTRPVVSMSANATVGSNF